MIIRFASPRLLGCAAALAAACAPSTPGAPDAGLPPASVPTNQALPADAGEPAATAAAADAAPPDAATSDAPCPAAMILLPGGAFDLGASHRRAAVAPFCIDAREVTVAAYAACVRAGRCSPRCLEENRCSAVPVDTQWGNPTEDRRASALCNGGRSDREAHPVNCVSFEEARAYCQARDKRLPREEEWEWAARSGPKATRFPWGIFPPTGAELCWSRPHKRDGTCPGGSFTTDRTFEGVLDLAGNLSEWVVSSKGTPALRGASFWSVDDGYVQAAIWGFHSPAPRSEVFGFRCARDGTPGATSSPAKASGRSP